MKMLLTVALVGFLVSLMILLGVYFYKARHRDEYPITEITLERKGCYGECPVG
jgi:hypothetical protein